MVNFIQSADSKIKINEDVSYLLNDALHVNAVFTASDIVKANKPVLRVNLPNVGKHAELNWYSISSDYIETYVQALATWIDNNLQVMVSKIVKYVWFEINEDGYFIAWIPDTWDFIDFDTEMNPDSEDYGKLALLWEPEAVQ